VKLKHPTEKFFEGFAPFRNILSTNSLMAATTVSAWRFSAESKG
jgi:hypothetical protein